MSVQVSTDLGCMGGLTRPGLGAGGTMVEGKD